MTKMLIGRRTALQGLTATTAMMALPRVARAQGTTLRWWSPQSAPLQVAAYETQIANFEAANPGVKVVGLVHFLSDWVLCSPCGALIIHESFTHEPILMIDDLMCLLVIFLSGKGIKREPIAGKINIKLERQRRIELELQCVDAIALEESNLPGGTGLVESHPIDDLAAFHGTTPRDGPHHFSIVRGGIEFIALAVDEHGKHHRCGRCQPVAEQPG